MKYYYAIYNQFNGNEYFRGFYETKNDVVSEVKHLVLIQKYPLDCIKVTEVTEAVLCVEDFLEEEEEEVPEEEIIDES